MTKIRKAVIPAAGLGTRFLPATIAQPKEMLVVVDKPVIQYVVEEAVAAGIEEILIITGRNKRAVEDHFDPPFELEDALLKKNKLEMLKSVQDISKLAHIHFVRQKKQLGLADAIYQGKYFAGSDPFAVLLGDTIITSSGEKSCLGEMVEVFEETGKAVVAGERLKDKRDVTRYGIIDFSTDGIKTQSGVSCYSVRDLVEKPEIGKAPSDLAIASRYIFNSDIFDLIEQTAPGKNNEIQITDSMRMLADKGGLFAYELNGKRYDIGNKVDYVKTNIDFALKNPATREEISAYIKNIS